MSYKMVYDRPSCIGAAACIAAAPDVWEMKDDGKVSIINGQGLGTDEETLTFEEKDLKMHVEAAKACPVNVIHILKDTGEKIV